MFTPISAVFGLLFFASTLPNGIRLVELPSQGDSVEIVAGYTSGGLTGFASTAAARALLFDAYACGAGIEFINERDRTGLRITAPKWSLPVLIERLPALFTEGAAPAAPFAAVDFRAKVEEEIRNALLGPNVAQFPYATDDAFILISAPAPNSLRDGLAAIPQRGSGQGSEEAAGRLPAERTLRFKSDLPEGAIIFASPISGVYYKQWYLVLLLDRLIQRTVPIRLRTALPLTVRPFYYRLEMAVPAGQFPEAAEENLLQELQRLQFAPASAKDLAAARQEAAAYLDSGPVREWFASHDLLARRDEGKQWIESMSADDMRIAARDLLIMNRVIATWAPKARQTSVTTEQLVQEKIGAQKRDVGAAPTGPTAATQVQRSPTPFPPHTHTAIPAALPERLASGVSLVPSSVNAIFVSGGAITRLDREFSNEDLTRHQQYRPDRILVLTPAAGMERARQLWSTFKGSTSGETGVSRGKVSSGDLAALLILKTFVDLKVIESGWWHEVSVRIDASEGSALQIHATEEKRAQILDWIKATANTAPTDAYFAWIREIAIHRFDWVRADLQSLTWERDAQGTVQDLETVSLQHVQDVARIYF